MKVTSATIKPLITEARYYSAWIRGRHGKAPVSGIEYVLWLWDNFPSGSVKVEVGGKKYSNIKGNPMVERFKGAFI